jgi:hypothetical protein
MRFARSGNTLSVHVDNILQCSHVMPGWDSAWNLLFTNAPLRFAGNLVNANDQSLFAQLSEIVLLNHSEPEPEPEPLPVPSITPGMIIERIKDWRVAVVQPNAHHMHTSGMMHLKD